MPRTSDAKDRTIRAAAKLFQRQGYHATGLAQLIAESGAPKGSFYYHFPGGKEELAIAAIAEAARDVEALIDHARQRHGEPAVMIRSIANGLARWLTNSQFTEGCPVATVTLETVPASPELRRACAAAYQRWIQALTDAFTDAGVEPTAAEAKATLVLAALEGALLLSRAQGDTQPLLTVAAALA